MSDEYTKKLEDVIKQMLKPIRGIPLNLVIESVSGSKIIPYDKKDKHDRKVLENLSNMAKIAGNDINSEGIIRTRANEVGNDIEAFVKKALEKIGYKCEIPSAKSGKRKLMGYPDIQFTDEFGRTNYLECKTFNIENISTTQRSFYLSPSEDFKITQDAHHFVISFEIITNGIQENKNIYKCQSWKILSIENLDVDVKYEFNSDNKRLYAKELILAEGNL
jgi:uncharacterized protein (UPF0128 family)